MNELESLKHPDLEISLGIDLTKFSTMRLRSQGDLVVAKSEEAVKHFINFINEKSLSYKVLGLGANQLIAESSNECYLKIELPFDKSYLENDQTSFILPASVPLSILSSLAIRQGYKGWEVFTGIPATLGGAIAMNAGTGLGEISEVVKRVRFLKKNGEMIDKVVDQANFSYRKNLFLYPGDIVLEVELVHYGKDKKVSEKIKEYLDFRNNSQPLKAKTCGCIFKNADQTCRAGKFIDIMGLKGFSHNGVRISSLHANFMENSGNASKDDVLKLIEKTKYELKLNYGIDFVTEVKFD